MSTMRAIGDELITRAANTIGVESARRGEFADLVREMLATLADCDWEVPSARTARTCMVQLTKSIDHLESALAEAPLTFQHVIMLGLENTLSAQNLDQAQEHLSSLWRPSLDDLRKRLATLRTAASFLADAIVSQQGRPLKLQKQFVASFSHGLITTFTLERPTLTTGGKYFCLAEILYEALTGKCPEADGEGMEYACRKALAEKMQTSKLRLSQ